MSTPAGGLVGDAHINVNANTDPAQRALTQLSRHADGRLRDMRGRFTSESRLIGTAFNRAAGGGALFDNALNKLKATAIGLSPALIPIAAQAAPIAASVGAASVAVAAFAAAAGGQVSALSEASEAEKKYKDAVDEHGAASAEAAKAQVTYQRQIEQMPHPTRVAAIALSSLKDRYQEWSDGLSASTMPVATKAFATFGAIFPKLTPMVQGAGTQLDRFVTIVAGGVESSAFDQFMRTFGEFSTGALQRGNEMLIRFMRTLNTGQVSGGASQFMEYVRENGPIVRETLGNLAQALSNVLRAAADMGPGLLTVVNVLASLVAAIPPGVLTAMLQLALAMKAVRLAAVAMAATQVGVAGFAASIGAMRLAAAGATGVLPRLGAAIATVSRTAKVAIAGTGIGLLLIALTELSQRGRQAPPDVDKLTTSLARLGRTGKVAGDGAKAFGSDLDGLYGKVRSLTDPSTTDKVQQFLVGWTGWDSTPVKDAKDNLGAVDEALAGLVKNGQADLAAAAVKRLTAEYGKGGRDTGEFTGKLTEYKASLEDAKFESMLAADAMGLFGQQAQQTSAKLAEQKASADGLRQAISALNDANRAGLGGMIGFEQAIDAAAKAAQENAGALTMSHGELNLNSEGAQKAATALNDLAAKTDEAAGAAREQGASWATVNGIYQRGRDELIKQADAMGLTREQARQLADQILKVPSGKKITLEMRTEDAISGLNGVIDAIKKTPNSKSVTVKALTADAVSLLRDLGFKVQKMPDGRFKVTAETGTAKANLAAVQRARDALKNKTIDLTARDRASATARSIQRAIDAIRGKTVTLTTVRHTINVEATAGRNARNYGATGGLYTGPARGFTHRGYAQGGLVDGPGTETSDSVPAPWLSKNEFVVNAKQTAKHLPLLKAINSGGIGMAAGGLAGAVGGMSSAGMDAGNGLASGLAGSTGAVLAAAKVMAAAVETGVRQELQIASPSKVTKALAADIGKGFISGLTSSREKIKAVSADLAKDIKAAFSGKKESGLLKMVARETNDLLAQATKRDAISKKIADANKFAADTAGQARSTGSLASIVQDDAYSPKYVENQMKASLASIKKFTSNVSALQKKGLNKDLLKQILEMGPEQGGAFAQSLMGADKATIKRFNSLNSQINSASSKLGKSGADMLYDSGKNAGKGFLTGLQGQKKDIEKLMLSIAKGMQAAIKKALGIKSPSTVFAAIGRHIGDGLVTGLTTSTPKVTAAVKKMTDAARTAAPKTLSKTRDQAAGGYAAAVAELKRLVDTGKWRKGGSQLFEDTSFQGMSKNFRAQQMKVADGFWAAVTEIKKAVKSGKKVFEDMTFKGMSGNVNRFHDVIAQIWKGNPYGRNFGDWGNFGTYGRYGKYASGGPIKGPGTSTSDSIPIWASDDEFMMRAAAVRHYGLPTMAALNSMRIPRGRLASSPTSRTAPSTTAAEVHHHYHLQLENRGVIGSQMQMQDWLAKALDNLARTNRLPASLRGTP